MTPLNKSVKRVTNTETAKLIIEIRPGATDTFVVREERHRHSYHIPIMKIFELGARLEADAKRAEKAAKKRAKKHA